MSEKVDTDHITLRLMILVGARMHGFPVKEITGPRRHKHLAIARWRIAKAARLAGYSYPKIAKAMNKNHTSILHGVKELEKIDNGDRLREAQAMLRQLRNGGTDGTD